MGSTDALEGEFDSQVADAELQGRGDTVSLLETVYLPYFASSDERRRASARRNYSSEFGRAALANKWGKGGVQSFLEEAGNAQDALAAYLDWLDSQGMEEYIPDVLAALREPLPTDEASLRTKLQMIARMEFPLAFQLYQKIKDLQLLLLMAYIEMNCLDGHDAVEASAPEAAVSSTLSPRAVKSVEIPDHLREDIERVRARLEHLLAEDVQWQCQGYRGSSPLKRLKMDASEGLELLTNLASTPLEDIERALHQRHPLRPDKTVLELLLSMQGGGQVLGVDRRAAPELIFRDRGPEPVIWFWDTNGEPVMMYDRDPVAEQELLSKGRPIEISYVAEVSINRPTKPPIKTYVDRWSSDYGKLSSTTSGSWDFINATPADFRALKRSPDYPELREMVCGTPGQPTGFKLFPNHGLPYVDAHVIATDRAWISAKAPADQNNWFFKLYNRENARIAIFEAGPPSDDFLAKYRADLRFDTDLLLTLGAVPCYISYCLDEPVNICKSGNNWTGFHEGRDALLPWLRSLNLSPVIGTVRMLRAPL